MIELSRRLRAIGVTGVAVLLTAVSAGVATADTAPANPADPGTPPTASSDSLPTVQVNGVVWQQVVIGSTVYAAGDFASARPAGSAPGVNEVSRKNLLAYDLATGALKTTFVADLNAQARTIAASPDGSRLYVGGDFTAVNGTVRNRLAAINPATGAVLADFAPSVNGRVSALAVTGTTVYAGGSFSTVNGTARNKVASVTATGGLVAGFAPAVAGGDVAALALSPVDNKLVIGGNFTTLNGRSDSGYGLGAVDRLNGTAVTFAANATVRNGGANAGITSLSSDATNVYGTGYVFGAGGNLEGAFSANWSDTRVRWLEDCHGDTYSVYPSGNAVYTASHAHYCGNIGGFPETPTRSFHRALAFSKAATGTVQANAVGNYYNFAGQPAPSLQTWFPDLDAGTYTGLSQGPWTVTGSGGYVLYGGEFTTVNGVRQQGLARFATSDIAPDKDGPRATGTDFQPTAVETAPGTVQISWPANWDRDNARLTYTVLQDGVAYPSQTATSSFWSRPTLSYTATNVAAGSHTYTVRAADPFGNTVTSLPVTTNQSVPTLTSRSPGGGVSGVAVTAPTKVTFSEAVTGVSTTSFTLKRSGTAVPATVVYDSASRTATLTPTAPLTSDSTHTVLLTSAIKSTSGGSLVPQSWNYITGPAPLVTGSTPANGATDVPVSSGSGPTTVTATFSEPVTGLPTTAAASTSFTLKLGTTNVASKVTYDAATRTATLVADAPLATDKKYTAALTASVKDVGGNPIAARSWTFTTGPRPVVTARTPASGSTGAARTGNVTATFSEAVAGLPTTAAASSAFTIKQTSTGATVGSAVRYDAATRTATLDPGVTLAAGTSYTVTLTSGVKDLVGNPLTTTTWAFTTGAS